MGSESGRYRLPKKRILRGRKAFQQVFAEGKRLKGRFVELFVLYNHEPRRVGFAVSRRLPGRVRKNRAKRRVREAFRLKQWEFPETGRYVFVARPEVLSAEWDDLLRDVEKLAWAARKELVDGPGCCA